MFFIIRLSRRDRVLYYSRIMDEVEEERWIYKTRRELKTTGLPSFPKKKKALFVCVFCRFLSKNEKKCRQKSVEEFVHETRTKKTRASNRRRRRRRENERKRVFFSPVVFASSFFFFCFFFPSARGKREISRGASRISTSTTDAAGN